MRKRTRSLVASLCFLILGLPYRGLAAEAATPHEATSPEVEALVRQLSSADEKQRASAAARLGRLGATAAPAVPSLVLRLTDHATPRHKGSVPMFSPAWEALEALTKIGRPATPHLLEALDAEDEVVRARVIEALGRIGDPAAKSRLLKLLADPVPDIRAQAALALGRIGDLDSVDPLLNAAKDPHSLVRVHALYGLRFSRDRRAVEPLVALLADPDYGHKFHVAQALGEIKDRRAVLPLIGALEDRTASVSAAAALGEIGDKRALAPLMELLDSSWSYSRIAAVRALLRFECPSAYAAVAGVFERDDDDLACVAAEELGGAGKSGVTVLAKALSAGSPRVKAAARAALKRIYGAPFDDGGEEWLVWKHEHFRPGSLTKALEEARVSSSETERALVQVSEFGVPEQTQVMRFLLAGEKVIASVRYADGTMPSPNRCGPQPITVPVIKTALVAWDRSGKLLWRTDLPSAYHLVMAGDEIVIAYDGGGMYSERGLIWIDPADGRELRRILLPGRPASLAYHQGTGLLIMIVYPQRRMVTLKDSWMEARAYRRDGSVAWTRKELVTELRAISIDGPAVVIGSWCHGKSFVAGLDPASGRQLWRRSWGWFPVPPEPNRKTPRSMSGLVCIPKIEGLEFVEPRTGETLHALPRPEGLPMTHVIAKGHADRVYLTSTKTEGVTLAALDFSSGKPIWKDLTGTVSYGSPATWGRNVVFLSRRLAECATGQVTHTELRVYSPSGSLLHHESGRNKAGARYWIDTLAPQVEGELLYAGRDSKLYSFRLEARGDRSGK